MLFSLDHLLFGLEVHPWRNQGKPLLQKHQEVKNPTFQPCFASKVPAVLPAGPSPTITMSKNSAMMLRNRYPL
jgi:hypothetical protein